MKRVYQQPIPTREERAAQLRRSSREADWERWKDLIVTCAWCFAWMLVGIGGIALALHTSDRRIGGIFFYAGQTVGYGGILVTLYLAYRRGQERGDW